MFLFLCWTICSLLYIVDSHKHKDKHKDKEHRHKDHKKDKEREKIKHSNRWEFYIDMTLLRVDDLTKAGFFSQNWLFWSCLNPLKGSYLTTRFMFNKALFWKWGILLTVLNILRRRIQSGWNTETQAFQQTWKNHSEFCWLHWNWNGSQTWTSETSGHYPDVLVYVTTTLASAPSVKSSLISFSFQVDIFFGVFYVFGTSFVTLRYICIIFVFQSWWIPRTISCCVLTWVHSDILQSFYFSHTAPLDNSWRLSRVQCMPESILQSPVMLNQQTYITQTPWNQLLLNDICSAFVIWNTVATALVSSVVWMKCLRAAVY